MLEKEKGLWGGVIDWISLAQDRYKWKALVNAVMNFWFQKMLRISQVAAQLLASRVVLISVQLVVS
jgi:hypothetical protein